MTNTQQTAAQKLEALYEEYGYDVHVYEVIELEEMTILRCDEPYDNNKFDIIQWRGIFLNPNMENLEESLRDNG